VLGYHITVFCPFHALLGGKLQSYRSRAASPLQTCKCPAPVNEIGIRITLRNTVLQLIFAA
jgi:hypothetical protein